MVDKVDRPERISSYRIEASRQATDEGSQRESQQQEQEHFIAGHESEWQKFNTTSVSLQTQKVAAKRVSKVRFKSVMLRQGIPSLLAQIDWANGQQTDAALFRLRHVEDYLKLKNYRPQQEVPAEFWSFGEEIEIAIPQKMSASGSFSLKKIEAQAAEHKPVKNQIWRQRFIFATVLLIIATLLWLEIFR